MDGQILNISPLIVWAVALSQLLTFGLTVWGLVSSGSRANARRLDDHANRLQGHADRITALEMAQESGPTRSDFHNLELKMSELQGAMHVLTQRLKPVEAISERLQEVLLERK